MSSNALLIPGVHSHPDHCCPDLGTASIVSFGKRILVADSPAIRAVALSTYLPHLNDDLNIAVAALTGLQNRRKTPGFAKIPAIRALVGYSTLSRKPRKSKAWKSPGILFLSPPRATG